MRLLLFSSNNEDKAFFEAAAKVANIGVKSVASADEVCTELQQDANAFVVIDASTAEQFKNFEKVVGEKIGLFSAILNANNLFYVASLPLHEAPYLAQSDIFGHFIHRTFTQEDHELIGRVFAAGALDKAFGLEHYLSKEARAQTLKLTKSLQKIAVVDQLKNYLVKIGFKARIATVIATAIDELIMNAIFDAPVDELGKHIHSQTPRNTAMELTDKNVVEVKIAFDGKLLGLSVIDQHGSLDKKKLLSQHISKSYESSQYEMKTVSAGAGLGLANVYRNCGGMVIVCETGGRTEVNLFFKKTESFKDFKDQFRFLSTFMYFS